MSLSPNRQRVVLVDEHPLVLEALSLRLSRLPEFEVIGSYGDSNQAFFEIMERRPELVITDLELSGRGAIELSDQVTSRLPETRLIFFTDYATDIFIDIALRLGIAGYLLKTEPVQRVVEAIIRVARGETVYSEAVMERLHFDRASNQFHVKVQAFFSNLTLRQLQVLRHLARGESVKEVARLMMLSERAIESHKYRIMQKMGIHDRVILTRYAIREGLMPA